MEAFVPEQTKHGIIKGRDALFLDKIKIINENQLVLSGDINTYGGTDEKYVIKFNYILYMNMIELDFAEGRGANFGSIINSKLLKKFSILDSARKLTDAHKHYYFCTYDIVFEVVASGYELKFSPL